MANYFSDDIDFASYLDETDAKARVKPARLWLEEIRDKIGKADLVKKVALPWSETSDKFNFRMGEVSIYGGYSGHGKSLVTTQIALSLMGQQEKVCIASFEMKPSVTLQRALRMFCGSNPFGDEFSQNPEAVDILKGLCEQFADWTDERLWLYDQVGKVRADLVIGMIRYAARTHGIKHYFIDSLMKCIEDEDDMNLQKRFMDQLCAVAKDEDVHIHLVHHMRKGESELKSPGKSDFRGSSAITDQADNLWCVWRNKPKEVDVKNLGKASLKIDEPDTFMTNVKHRNGDDEPVVSLWHDRDSNQMLSTKGGRPLYFPNYPHYQE